MLTSVRDNLSNLSDSDPDPDMDSNNKRFPTLFNKYQHRSVHQSKNYLKPTNYKSYRDDINKPSLKVVGDRINKKSQSKRNQTVPRND